MSVDKNLLCHLPFRQVTISNRMTKMCCHVEEGFFRDDKLGLKHFWQSRSVKDLQDRVLKGDYSKCPDHCGILMEARLKAPKEKSLIDYSMIRPISSIEVEELKSRVGPKSLVMALEDGCNLACPSCRPDFRGNSLDSLEIDEIWAKTLDDLSMVEELVLGGSGEPLIQKNVKDFLFNFDILKTPRLKKIYIQTNALALDREYWQKIDPAKKSLIHLLVSIDGASSKTYEVNRKGGSFHKLQQNLSFISELNLPYFEIGMVVQKNNYFEMSDFISWARALGAKANFQKLEDWSCMEDFIESDISNPKHIEHRNFLDHLNSLKLSEDVQLTNLTDFLN